MADNVAITPGSGATAAADDIGGVLHQRIKLTLGADGVSDGDVSSTNPIPVRFDQGPEAIISSNGSLQVDATQVNEQSAETLNAPNAALLGDEPVQMVGLHPSYPLPIDTATPMPIAGRDATGAQRQAIVDKNGAFLSSTETTVIPIVARFNTGETGTFALIDCDGYQSVIAQQITGSSSAPVEIEWSMNSVNWVKAIAFNHTGTGVQQYATATNIITTNGIYSIPVIGRYLRFTCGVNASTTTFTWNVYLRRNPLTFGTIPYNAQINLTQIAGTGVSNASAQLGVNAFGPTAPGAAHSTNNPVQMSGSDGTNVRRILTDTSGNTRVVGPLAAGTSLIGATNAAFAPELMGITDLEGKVQRATGDVRGRLAATLPDATAPAEEGIIDALNNVVRELKLLNAKITDLPYWLGINSVMPDDGQNFRDDPTLFNQ